MPVLPAYTKLLFSSGDVPSSGDQQLAQPPTGFRWVIRDIVMNFAAGGATVFYSPAYVHDGNGAIILASPGGRTTGFTTYRFDGHQVIDHPDWLWMYVPQDGWSLRVTGYELSIAG